MLHISIQKVHRWLCLALQGFRFTQLPDMGLGSPPPLIPPRGGAPPGTSLRWWEKYTFILIFGSWIILYYIDSIVCACYKIKHKINLKNITKCIFYFCFCLQNICVCVLCKYKHMHILYIFKKNMMIFGNIYKHIHLYINILRFYIIYKYI